MQNSDQSDRAVGLDFGTTNSAVAVAATGVRPEAIDRVFLTGGSSFVPAVRDIFIRTFGRDKLAGGNELTSVATGLALRGLV